MIQVNELRVGNLLTYKGRIITVDGVENDTDTYRETWLIWIKGKGQAEPIADFAPIPLSPKILEACGFETPGHSRVQRLTIDYADTDYPCTLQVSGSGIQVCRSGIGAICPEIKYLHQLQNLVHILTGSELSVNLEKAKA